VSSVRAWLGKATTGAATAAIFFVAGSRPAQAARNQAPPEPKGRIEISFDGEPRELSAAEKGVCTLISAAAAGGLLYWGKVSGDKEEEEEATRIKSETERLNKMRDEFLMDDEVVQDDDLFSSLRKRMENADGAPTDDDDGPDFPGPEPDSPRAPPDTPRGGLDMPVRDSPPPPSPEPDDDDDDDSAGSRDADIERLKRMFGSE